MSDRSVDGPVSSPPRPPTPAGVSRSITGRLLLLLASIGIALLASEVALRLVWTDLLAPYPERSLWRHDDVLGWSHAPGQDSWIEHPEYRIRVRTNRHGLRDRDYDEQRAPGKKRLLVLGDSFAWGLGVEREEIFCELIEKRHPAWEVINAGVSGYGTDQELLYYEHRGFRYRPDVVLLLLHENDARNNATSSQQGRDKPRFREVDGKLVVENLPVPAPSLWERFERAALRSSRLAGALYPRARQTLQNLVSGPPADDLDLTVRLLARLAREVEARGARLVVVSVPMARARRERLAAGLEELGVPYLPLDEAFDRALEEELERWRRAHPAAPAEERPISPFLYRTDFHWNARGHRVAADAVEEFLIDLGILETQ